MLHNLGQLRTSVLNWLDDPSGDSFAPAGNFGRLDQLINEAYASAVDELDTIPQPWNMLRDENAISVTTVAGTREYLLGDLRNVVEVVEELSDGTDSAPLPIVPHWKRNTAGAGVYLFRNQVLGDFFIGLVIFKTPQYAKLRIFIRDTVKRLSSPSAFPSQLPEQWHELIVYKAAMLGQMQEKRDAKALTALYGEKLKALHSAKPVGNPMRVRRMGD